MRDHKEKDMKYQLVLQFDADSLSDFDSLVRLEERLIRLLGPHHDVDGHDFGSGQMNIFIFTNDPVQVFDMARTAIPDAMSSSLRCAYRHIGGDEFTVICPIEDHREFVVR